MRRTQDQRQSAAAVQMRPATLFLLAHCFFSLLFLVCECHQHDGTPEILRTIEAVKAKCELVETLLEVETATRLLRESKAKANSGDAGAAADEAAAGQSNDPIDVHFRSLHADIQPIERNTPDFELVQKYIRNTHAPTHTNYTLDLIDVFSIDRENEGERYKDFESDENRMLLWHGSRWDTSDREGEAESKQRELHEHAIAHSCESACRCLLLRTTNFAGIISQGLRIAPPEGQTDRRAGSADLYCSPTLHSFTHSLISFALCSSDPPLSFVG